jgi:hypothetical protein
MGGAARAVSCASNQQLAGSMTLDDLESFAALDGQCIHRMCTVYSLLKRSFWQIALKLRRF